MAPFDNILRTIGRTPIVKINRLFPSSVSAFCKLERANPGGSIKDRIALSMIEVCPPRLDVYAAARPLAACWLHIQFSNPSTYSTTLRRTRSAGACSRRAA
jgi:hypothetical protein